MIRKLSKYVGEYKKATILTPIMVTMEVAVSYTHLDVYKRQKEPFKIPEFYLLSV